MIGPLYEIDERAEGDLAKKAELRRTESTEALATLKTWLWSQAALKSLSIGNAAAYVVANWDRPEVAAVFYTLLEIAKLAGIDPAKYMREAALADVRVEVPLPVDV